MKHIVKLCDRWKLCEYPPTDKLDEKQLDFLESGNNQESIKWFTSTMPAQVHEVLMKEGIIEDPSLLGKAEECKWVSDKDWIYKCEFEGHETEGKTYINFKGLDTIVDIYLNSGLIARHQSIYLPLKLDISKYAKDKNILVLHFHSPYEYVKKYEMPEKWIKKINPFHVLRKPKEDFTDYLGVKPYLTPIGIFDDILLEFAESTEILEMDIKQKLSSNYETGNIEINVTGAGCAENSVLEVKIQDHNGEIVGQATKQVKGYTADEWNVFFSIDVINPKLWWPKSYGEQPLYKITANILKEKVIEDSACKSIGFRNIVMKDSFDFEINGKRIRLWGANLAPLKGISHCWDNEKSTAILDMVENCNMNIIRLWGGGTLCNDSLFDEADRRGLLLWQEFFHNYGLYPDSEKFKNICKQEAEYIVKHLKHHPSILMWCGGNEVFLGAEQQIPEEEFIGSELFEKDYKDICNRLDADRVYLINSPYGGNYTNDPTESDTHGYSHTWYVPGIEYPVMVSEDTRASIPHIKSLERYIGKENLWPEGYNSMKTKYGQYPIPQTWMMRASAEAWKKFDHYEKFYDADSPEALIYKITAARGLYLRESIEKCRRGRPSYEASGKRKCMGYLVWKLNDTWPQIFCSVIDYYLEPYIPYYALKRAYEPVLLSFDIQDHINLWVVNDSAKNLEGNVIFKLFNPIENKLLREITKKVSLCPDESKIVLNLDVLGQIKRENILYACLVGSDGQIITRTNDFVNIERNLFFPDAKLDITMNKDIIRITTDKFARCVELSGNDGGDQFGWFFEDNYFDLLPGEVKILKILRKHPKGIISAKAYYSKYVTIIEYMDSEISVEM